MREARSAGYTKRGVARALAARVLWAGVAVIAGACAGRVASRAPAVPVDGRCGAEPGICLLGTPEPLDAGGDSTGWRCAGLNGGRTVSCSVLPPPATAVPPPAPDSAGPGVRNAPRPAASPVTRDGPIRPVPFAPGGVAAAPTGTTRPPLFSPIEPPVAPMEPPVPADPIALRRRLVAVNAEMLRRAQASAARPEEPPAVLTLNLFDDVVHEGVIEGTAPTFSGGYSLSGVLADDPLGTVTLVVNGETVAGTVRTVRGTYSIRSAGGGRYSISELDPSQMPDLENDTVTPEDIETLDAVSGPDDRSR